MDKNQMAVDIFNRQATLYQNKFMDVSLYADTLDLFCLKTEKTDADILEIACGPGNITRYLLQRSPGFKISGIDLAPNMIELAKKNNPSAEFNVMDCRQIASITKVFDAVMCGFCLPYLSKEETFQLISDVAGLLKTGGIFYLSTMEDEYSKSGFRIGSSGEQMFMHYHEAGYLENKLILAGLEIESINRQEYHENDGTISTDLIIIARKS